MKTTTTGISRGSGIHWANEVVLMIFIQDQGVIVCGNDRSVAVFMAIDAEKYVSGTKSDPFVWKQWRVHHAIACNGQYFQCKHGNSHRPQTIFGYEYGLGDRYFPSSDCYDAPFETSGQWWGDEWAINATRRECVHNGVEEVVSLKGWRQWIKARERASACMLFEESVSIMV